MRNPLSKVITEIEPSGIRKFFDIVSEMKDAISLGVGEPDFDTPWHIRDEGIYSLEKGRTFYTSNAGLKELKIEISNFLNRKYGLDYDYNHEIMVTVGGSEAIDIAMRAMLDPGDEVLIPQPSYVSYLPCARLAGGVPVVIELKAENQFRLTRDELEAAITPKTKILVLPFPNNPTGAVMERSDLEELVDVIVANDLYVITDEIYSELTYTEEGHVSIAAMPGMRDRTIYINGLSKSHAMTGWRIGLIFAPAVLTAQLIKSHQYLVTAAATMAQFAAIEALSAGKDDAQPMKVEYLKRRDYILEKMTELGFKIIKPDGAFYIFAKIPEGYTQDSFKFCQDFAREKAIAIIPGVAFGKYGEGYVRLSYAASMDTIETAMTRLKEFMEEHAEA